jgi:hypothetical protein
MRYVAGASVCCGGRFAINSRDGNLFAAPIGEFCD